MWRDLVLFWFRSFTCTVWLFFHGLLERLGGLGHSFKIERPRSRMWPKADSCGQEMKGCQLNVDVHLNVIFIIIIWKYFSSNVNLISEYSVLDKIKHDCNMYSSPQSFTSHVHILQTSLSPCPCGRKLFPAKVRLQIIYARLIYLKISYRKRIKSICFQEPIYCPVWTQYTLLNLINLWSTFECLIDGLILR